MAQNNKAVQTPKSKSGRLVQYENGQHHLYHRRSFQHREQRHLGGQDEAADA